MKTKIRTAVHDGVLPKTHILPDNQACLCLECGIVIKDGFVLPGFEMDTERIAKHSGHHLVYRDNKDEISITKVG